MLFVILLLGTSQILKVLGLEVADWVTFSFYVIVPIAATGAFSKAAGDCARSMLRNAGALFFIVMAVLYFIKMISPS